VLFAQKNGNGRFFDVMAITEQNLITCAYGRTEFNNGRKVVTAMAEQQWNAGNHTYLVAITWVPGAGFTFK